MRVIASCTAAPRRRNGSRHGSRPAREEPRRRKTQIRSSKHRPQSKLIPSRYSQHRLPPWLTIQSARWLSSTSAPTGLVVIVLFESALNVLRTYIFGHTTSRIDVELGARLFRHLMNLPLAYFQARRVGDSVARVRELENIRQFLTGNALTLVLDVIFSLIFVAVMLNYSVALTLIVLLSLPLYLCLSLIIVPVLRARLNEKFARGAENQSLLVEAITGIQTVKASALEPQMGRRWDGQ